MNRRFAAFSLLLSILLASCEKHVEYVSVVKADGGLAPQPYVPASGGIVSWDTSNQSFQIVPTTTWPCTLKDNGKPGKDKVVTCEFKAVGSDDWQEWRYTIQPESGQGKGTTKNNKQGPPETLLVGHCQNCTAIKTPQQLAAASGNTTYANVSCGDTSPEVNKTQTNITVNVGAEIDWLVNGTNPMATINADPNTCSGIDGQGTSDIKCTVKQSGHYTISGWPKCNNSATSPSYQITVLPPQQ